MLLHCNKIFFNEKNFQKNQLKTLLGKGCTKRQELVYDGAKKEKLLKLFAAKSFSKLSFENLACKGF